MRAASSSHFGPEAMFSSSSHGLIKICGVRREADVEAAVLGGAQLIGLMFVPGSRRRLDLARAQQLRHVVGSRALAVGVFMDQPLAEVMEIATALRLDALQLHGTESIDEWRAAGRPLIKRVAPLNFDAASWPSDVLPLLDPGAGNGVAFDWQSAGLAIGDSTNGSAMRGAMLAGGLTPSNVAQTVLTTGARGVDVSSGVEVANGVKDVAAILAFCHCARAAFDRIKPSGSRPASTAR